MRARLEGLCKRFGEREVVRKLDLAVPEGDIVCLLGPSGCGKTTTLRLLGGFLAADAGEIWVDERRIDRLPPEKRPLATVFQSYALFPNRDVLGNVSYGLPFHGLRGREAEDRAWEMLRLVGLEEYAYSGIRELSGGQQQRVALARALAISPSLLLMDEPLSNLDAKLRVQIRAELKALQHSLNMTIIFVTHDQEEAMVLGDSIAIMNEGRLEQIGSPEEVYAHPKSRFVMDFLGESNCLRDYEKGERFCFRPEAIRIREEGEYRAAVLTEEFRGFYRQYRLRCGEDILTYRAAIDTALPVGAEIGFSIEPEQILLREPLGEGLARGG